MRQCLQRRNTSIREPNVPELCQLAGICDRLQRNRYNLSLNGQKDRVFILGRVRLAENLHLVSIHRERCACCRGAHKFFAYSGFIALSMLVRRKRRPITSFVPCTYQDTMEHNAAQQSRAVTASGREESSQLSSGRHKAQIVQIIHNPRNQEIRQLQMEKPG